MEQTITDIQARQYNPLALAFLGDCVFERCVRKHLVLQANRPAAKLHDAKVKYVCADYQAKAAELLLPNLTETEQGVYRRGRNAHNTVPRHTPAQVYHKATGLEALFGYLELIGAQQRIQELFEKILTEIPVEEKE